MTRSNTMLAETEGPTYSIRIKDIMLGELLCHAGFLKDRELLELVMKARRARVSLGVVLVALGHLNPSQLFVGRRILNRYLNDADRVDYYIKELRQALGESRFARRKSSFALATTRSA